MKTAWILLVTALSASSVFADDNYTGKSILDYLAPGHYYGERCEVVVSYSETFKNVSVVVKEQPDIYRPFNNLIGTKENTFEDRQAGGYVGSFVFVPDDEYTGRRRYEIKIEGKNRGRIRVTTSEAQRLFGIWLAPSKAVCTINL